MADGLSGAAANAASRVPSDDSRTSSSCETAAPAIAGMGGCESSSKHMRGVYEFAFRPPGARRAALDGATAGACSLAPMGDLQIPSFTDVLAARKRIAPFLRPTPLYGYAALGELV